MRLLKHNKFISILYLTEPLSKASYGYDGFGNLTQQTPAQGTVPTMSVTVDPATNRITTAGYGYDANGNLTQTPGGPAYGYDVANRMVTNQAVYNPKNQRVFDGTYLYYYGLGGELLGKYQPIWGSTTTVSGVAYTTVMQQDHQSNLYFNGRAIRLQGHGYFVMTDRVGSVRVNGLGQRISYYPYGGEVGTEAAEGRGKFGTYTRDSAGVDYADQRYYGAAIGRFLTPDPSTGTSPSDPGGWNSYAYVQGDPVNFKDLHGLFRSAEDDDNEEGWDPGFVFGLLLQTGKAKYGPVTGGVEKLTQFSIDFRKPGPKSSISDL